MYHKAFEFSRELFTEEDLGIITKQEVKEPAPGPLKASSEMEMPKKYLPIKLTEKSFESLKVAVGSSKNREFLLMQELVSLTFKFKDANYTAQLQSDKSIMLKHPTNEKLNLILISKGGDLVSKGDNPEIAREEEELISAFKEAVIKRAQEELLIREADQVNGFYLLHMLSATKSLSLSSDIKIPTTLVTKEAPLYFAWKKE